MRAPLKSAVDGARDLLSSPAGVASFRRTGTTPHGTYRVMRKTLTVAPRLAPRVYRLVLPTTPAVLDEDLGGALGPVAPGDIARIADDLRRDGLVRLDRRVDQHTCDALEQVGRRATADLMPAPPHGAPSAVFDATQPRAPKYSIPETTLLAAPAAQGLATDRSLRAVAAAYLGCEPVCSLSALWWSVPWEGGASSEIAQLFHEDRDHPAFLKFFLYVTDVDEAHGPHVFVRGSHRDRRPGLRADRRFTDDQVGRRYGTDDILTVCGRRGTLFAADTRGLHKGLPPEAGPRLVFQLEFATSLFGAAYARIDPATLTTEATAEVTAHPHTYQRFASGVG